MRNAPHNRRCFSQPSFDVPTGRVIPASFEMNLKTGGRIRLLPRDIAILFCLYEHRGKIVSRASLKDDVWGTDSNTVSRVVDQHVYRLRARLGPDGNCIETVSTHGYRIGSDKSDHLPKQEPVGDTTRANVPRRRYFNVGVGQIDLWHSRWRESGFTASFTLREMRLLHYFIVHPDTCVSFRRVGRILGGDVQRPDQTMKIRQIVCRLRVKLHSAAGSIQSIYGTGYRFMC